MGDVLFRQRIEERLATDAPDDQSAGESQESVLQLEEQTVDAPQFPLKCGRTLTLQPSRNPFAVKHFHSEAARYRQIHNNGATAQQKQELEEFTERLFLYLAGWCVVDDPPPDAIEEINRFFGGAKSDRIMRAKWVRYILLSDKSEAADFIAACLLVTEQLG